MNHIKSFFREKGLYLFCLALVFAATAAGILALRSVVNNMTELTQLRKDALQEDSTWDQPDTTVNNPASDVPEPTSTPSAPPSGQGASSGASSAPAAASAAPSAAAAPSAPSAALPELWQAAPAAEFSGEELVYNETLGDWRTHNGADYACQLGEDVLAPVSGTVESLAPEGNWGVVAALRDAEGRLWRIAALAEAAVQEGDAVTAGQKLGTAGSITGESALDPHIHIEVLEEDKYLDPVALLGS